MRGLDDLRYKETRPIQSAVISLGAGRPRPDCLRRDRHGQDAAFVLPMLHRLVTEPPAPHSRALVLAPTRELAVQIEDEMHGLSYHTDITSVAVYGGVAMDPQERALKAGVDVIVATPGRLMDHMRQGNAELDNIGVLVLDEADRMMDMGFWPDVRRIIAALPAKRQTLLFSATMPQEIVDLAKEIIHDPKYVQVGEASAAARTITHAVPRAAVGREGRMAGCDPPPDRRAGAGVRPDQARRRPAGPAAGGVGHPRDRAARRSIAGTPSGAVEGFRVGSYRVLVATDIAARGLDIDGISTSSTTKCRRRPTATCTASAARAGPRRRARPSPWWRRRSGAPSRRSSR